MQASMTSSDCCNARSAENILWVVKNCCTSSREAASQKVWVTSTMFAPVVMVSFFSTLGHCCFTHAQAAWRVAELSIMLATQYTAVKLWTSGAVQDSKRRCVRSGSRNSDNAVIRLEYCSTER